MPTQARNASAAPEYRSSHFNEPNILAHRRVNDRVDAEGKKMLLIEEVQSDWHQAGREKGYKGKGTLTKLPDNYFVQELKTIDGDTMYVVRDNSNPSVIINKDYNRQSAINGVINELNATSAGGVPDAPFKDTWHQLALKRAIKEAVDKGYDRIGLTTGKRQIERYTDELRQNVSEINFQTGAKLTPAESAEIKAFRQQQTYMTGTEKQRYEYLSGKEGAPVNQDETLITAFNGSRPAFTGKVKNGKFIEGPDKALGKTLEEVLGKSIAKQIEEKKTGNLTGGNLTIGGEGMKKYYDEVYPNYLNKLGKKYGAQVGETNVKTQTGEPAFVDYIVGPGNFNDTTVLGLRSDGTTSIINQNANSMEEAQQLVNRYKKEKNLGGGGEPVRYLDITPEMRKAIKEGQPLASIEEELAKALA
jgi:hypothetical protein